MLLLQRIALKTALIVPLVGGIMLSAVIGAPTIFLAVYFDLLQSLDAWTSGDFPVSYKVVMSCYGLSVPLH